MTRRQSSHTTASFGLEHVRNRTGRLCKNATQVGKHISPMGTAALQIDVLCIKTAIRQLFNIERHFVASPQWSALKRRIMGEDDGRDVWVLDEPKSLFNLIPRNSSG